MIIRIGKAGVQEGHIVDLFREMRKDLGNPGTTFAMLSKSERRLHQGTDLAREETGVLIEAREFLTVALGELRLVVPGIDLAGPTVHEQPDDALGFGWEMGRFCRQRIELRVDCRGSRRAQQTLL